MTHWRQTLREAAVERLRGAGTLAGIRVYSGRVAKLDCRKETFPIIAIYAKSDTLSRKAEASSWDAAGKVVVACFVKGEKAGALTAEEVASASLDDLCDQVESVLLGDGRWESASQVKAQRVETNIEMFDAEHLVFMAKLTIDVETDATISPVEDPGAPLTTITVTNDNSPADDEIDTYDVIALDQEE